MAKFHFSNMFLYAVASILAVALLIVAGSFFYEAPKLKIEIEGGSPQDLEKGKAMNYRIIYFDEKEENASTQNLTFVYLGNKCIETLMENQSIATHCGSEFAVQFPLLLAYPKNSDKTVVLLCSEGKNSRQVLSQIEYVKIRELEYKNKLSIEVLSSAGETFILEKKTGMILLLNSSSIYAELLSE